MMKNAKAGSGAARPALTTDGLDGLLLAAECNLMRWRTAKGMVDEKRWDEFVQYVRRGMEKVGIRSSKGAWPDMKWFQAARELDYHRLDY